MGYRKKISPEQYIEGVLDGNRAILAQTITLIESNAKRHFQIARQVLQKLLPYSGKSVRIGITGVPGAGKSTFIDSLGTLLCEKGHRVAVLAVDPSSSLTKGSIMGDKTRMETLSREPNCFIRPSPSGGALGGVNRKTRETILVCEAAGFDVILVETVGVGQSEVMVSSMADFFLLLAITGAGDELQSIKKGIIELADAILINKADGDNKLRAERMRSEFNQALHYLTPATKGWETKAYCCSSLTGEGVEDIWEVIVDFKNKMEKSELFFQKRRTQSINWLRDMLTEQIKVRFFNHDDIVSLLPKVERQISDGLVTVAGAADLLLEQFYGVEN